MQFLTVTLSAAVNGNLLTLYDADGRKIGTVGKAKARPATEHQLDGILWTRKLKAMCIANLKAKGHAVRDGSEWGVKIDTWIKATRLRQIDKSRPREGKRYFSNESRPDWNAAIKCMRFSHRSRLNRKARHSQNPWLTWSETCSKNHNRKERNRVAERQQMRVERRSRFINTTERASGITKVQMRFDWNGVDASAVIA